MAKDPAFNFYTNDFDQKTKFFTHEQVGMYLRLLMAQHQHGHLTEAQMMFVCGRRDDTVFSKFTKDENGLFYNDRLKAEIEKRQAYTESRRQSRLKADEDQVRIYLIKDLDTGYFKIGSSVNPMRRFAEMCNRKNPAITVGNRNYELYWQSGIVQRSEEKKMHAHFKSKNIKGEWFSLSESDVCFIVSTYSEGTYVKRTSERTENEYEIENEIRNSIKKESSKKIESASRETIDFEVSDIEGDELVFPLNTKPVKDLWTTWKKYRWEKYQARYGFMGEQADLKRLEGMSFNQIESTILAAISNGWKNLYPEQNRNNGKSNGAGNKKQQHTSSAAQYVADHYSGKLKGGAGKPNGSGSYEQ